MFEREGFLFRTLNIRNLHCVLIILCLSKVFMIVSTVPSDDQECRKHIPRCHVDNTGHRYKKKYDNKRMMSRNTYFMHRKKTDERREEEEEEKKTTNGR